MVELGNYCYIFVSKYTFEFNHIKIRPVIELGGFFYLVMFEVYSFQENHSLIKKRGLFSVPTNKSGQCSNMTTRDLTFIQLVARGAENTL
jgi:hypothetical protein